MEVSIPLVQAPVRQEVHLVPAVRQELQGTYVNRLFPHKSVNH